MFKVIPLTYHITSLTDPVYEEFIQEGEFKCGKLWIVKPGEQSNRGNGITVINSPHKLTNILKKQ